MTDTSTPSGSVETPTLVITGGMDGVALPFESVPVTNTGELNVLSGGSVIVDVEIVLKFPPLPDSVGTWKGG